MKTSIGRKISIAFLILLALMGGLVWITHVGYKDVIGSLERMEREAVKRGAAGNLRFSVAQLLMSVNDYIITENIIYRGEFDKYSDKVDQMIEGLYSLPLTSEELNIVDEIRWCVDSVRANAEHIYRIPNPKTSQDAANLMEVMDFRFGNKVNRKTTEIFDLISDRITSERVVAAQNKERALYTTYFVIALAVSISFGFIMLTVQKISKPILAVTNAAHEIANGNYSYRPQVASHDEIGSLAEMFSHMAEAIQQTQKALELSKRFNESIVASIPPAVVVFDMNSNVISVNQRFHQLFSKTADISRIKEVEELLHSIGLFDECRKAILARETIHNCECSFLLSGKEMRWLNVTLTQFSAEESSENEETKFLLVLDEITERKQAQERLQFHETVLQNVRDSIIVTDPKGKVMYWNKGAEVIFGYSSKEMTGKRLYPLFFEGDARPADTSLEAIQSQRELRVEWRARRKDGSAVWLDSKRNIVLDSTGKLIGFIGVGKDITIRKDLEVKLQTFHNAVEQTADMIFITDRDGLIEYVNPSFEKLTGYSKEEIIGNTPRILKSDKQDKYYYDILWKVILSGRVFRSSVINKKKNGEFYYAEQTITPITNALGTVTHFISTCKDVTEQKQAEEALRRSEERYRNLVDTSPEVIYSLSVPDGIITSLNPTFEHITGYKRDEWIGKSFIPLIHPDDLWLALETTNQIAQGITPSPYELRVRTKSEEYVIGEFTSAPLMENGNVIGEFGIVRDVTERKRMSAKLIASEKRFRAMIEKMADSFALLDSDGTIIYRSPSGENIFGFTNDEVIGSNVFQNLHPDDCNRVKRIFRRLLLTPGLSISADVRSMHKNGSWIYCEATGTNMLDDPDVNAIVANYRNITERKQVEFELIAAKEHAEQSERLKDAFISNMSHEIRTPLNIILGYKGLVEEALHDSIGNQERVYFERIQSGCMRLMRTVEHILNMSSIQAGTFYLKQEKMDISTQLRALIADMQHAASERDLLLECKIEAEIAHIFVDRYCIEQALLNLIDNAIKFTETGGVFIRLFKEQENICLSIRDTGIGISEEYLPDIFAPYSQEISGHSRPYEGLGLGLALTKRYIELNDGVLEVQTKVGKGTEFSICFPSYSIEPQEETPEPDVPKEPSFRPTPHGQRRGILIVEDDEQNQKFMRLLFEKEHETFVAASAQDAWDILVKERIDIILMDPSLRGEKDGLQLTAEIRAMERFASIPIIAVSAHAFPRDRENSLAAGCDDFISKPFLRAEILARIEIFLSKS